MTARFRIVWLLVLCFFLASCSGYHQVGMPLSCDPGEDTNEPDDGAIKPGDKVRVTVNSGETVIGTLFSCNNTALAIDEQKVVGIDVYSNEISIQSRHVLFVADIRSVEVYWTNNTGPLLISLGVFLVFAGAMAAKSLENSMDFGFSLSE